MGYESVGCPTCGIPIYWFDCAPGLGECLGCGAEFQFIPEDKQDGRGVRRGRQDSVGEDSQIGRVVEDGGMGHVSGLGSGDGRRSS
jgi:DNA-directed RNA polymerase subunit RPC12/RpoP